MDIMQSFPKQRPSLPREVKKIFNDVYKRNRQGRTSASFLSKIMEGWMHKQVALDVVGTGAGAGRTLDVGAGTLNHIPYEFGEHPYDIVEPNRFLYVDSPELTRVRNIYADVSEIPLCNSYDRVVSIATFEHICNLPEVVARLGLLMSGSGVLRVGIPNEGSLLWLLGWKLTTGLEFWIKYGLDYGLIMKHEHVNSAHEIELVLNFFFEEVKVKAYGLTKKWSLYHYFEVRKPDRQKCLRHSGERA